MAILVFKNSNGFNLALIGMEILFLFSLKSKRLECKAGITNADKAQTFATKLHYFESIFDSYIDFLQLIFGDDVGR